MTLRAQIVGAALLAATTYAALLRVAEAKNETAVGGRVFPLDERRREEREAFERLRAELAARGEQAFADRLEELRAKEKLWVASSLGPERWAVFVDSLRLVRRIYVRRLALLDPQRHLYPDPRPDIPGAERRAFAWLGLAGALKHELAHYDGTIDEAGAYAREIAWYEGLRASSWFASLGREERRVWDWALDSAVRSARKASETAGS